MNRSELDARVGESERDLIGGSVDRDAPVETVGLRPLVGKVPTRGQPAGARTGRRPARERLGGGRADKSGPVNRRLSLDRGEERPRGVHEARHGRQRSARERDRMVEVEAELGPELSDGGVREVREDGVVAEGCDGLDREVSLTGNDVDPREVEGRLVTTGLARRERGDENVLVLGGRARNGQRIPEPSRSRSTKGPRRTSVSRSRS